MQFLNILLSSLGSIIVLFILTKIVGNKQISHMNMFDYINGITIGSIAAEMATALEKDFLVPLAAMLIYGAAAALMSYLATKSIRIRRIFTGRSIILLDKGKIYKKNLAKARLDVNEFLAQCRINGFFNLSDIETAIIEPNGMLSFLPVSLKRPVNPTDLNLSPSVERPIVNVIMDSHIMKENLKYTGNDENWLDKKLKEKGVKTIKNVFLATCDNNNELEVYIKLPDKPTNDIFQ